MKFRLNCEQMELRDTPAVLPVDPTSDPGAFPPAKDTPPPQQAPTPVDSGPREPLPPPAW
jgi:hypothetical protein